MRNKAVWMGVSLGSVLAIGVMGTFFSAVSPKIPHSYEEWGSFGSILSAAFTLLATFATLATLMTVVKQQKEQSLINEEQIKSSIFQQYFSHRALFIERIKALETSFKGEYKFEELDLLYEKIFPENSPTHCQLIINNTHNTESEIFRMKECIDLLSSEFFRESSNNSKLELPFYPNMVLKSLYLSFCGTSKDGDFMMMNQEEVVNTGVNIYSIENSMYICTKTYNNIAAFAGYEEIPYDAIQKNCEILKPELMALYAKEHKPNAGFFALKTWPMLLEWEILYTHLRDNFQHSKTDLFKNSIVLLDKHFSSAINVKKFSNSSEQYKVIRMIKDELSGEELLFDMKSEIMIEIVRITDKINTHLEFN